MKATIVYSSAKGKTAQYAREMAMHLWSKGWSVSMMSVSDFTPDKLEHTDALLLGCWTSGWFVINQHPNKRWQAFARKLPEHLPHKTVLFTTYLIRTGSLFSRMRKAIPALQSHRQLCLASKTGLLTDTEKERLDNFLQSGPQP